MGFRIDKAVTMIRYNPESVLDLGCRDKALKAQLGGDVQYRGIDFREEEDVTAHNLEQGIPFEDNSFDAVFALDVLEHVENVHFLFDEMLRVARKEVIVSLPNIFYYRLRLAYMFKAKISGKYIFPEEPVLDRHRWLTSWDSSIAFVKHRAKDHGVHIERGKQSEYPLLNKVELVGASVLPNLFASTAYFHIDVRS